MQSLQYHTVPVLYPASTVATPCSHSSRRTVPYRTVVPLAALLPRRRCPAEQTRQHSTARVPDESGQPPSLEGDALLRSAALQYGTVVGTVRVRYCPADGYEYCTSRTAGWARGHLVSMTVSWIAG